MTKTSDAYTDGYMDGNNSAHAELRVWQVGDHESTCVCEICRTGRVIVEHVLLPDSHIEGCSRPCGESCSCWCHAGGIVERSPRNRRQRAYNRDRVSTPCQRLRRERKEELPHPMLHNRARSRRDRRPALRWTRGGLEPRRCSRPARDAAPTIAPTIFCSVRPRPSPCSWWACPALTSMCWPWSPPLPTSTNPARCPRCARLRGDRRETDARGRAERPSKWRG